MGGSNGGAPSGHLAWVGSTGAAGGTRGLTPHLDREFSGFPLSGRVSSFGDVATRLRASDLASPAPRACCACTVHRTGTFVKLREPLAPVIATR